MQYGSPKNALMLRRPDSCDRHHALNGSLLKATISHIELLHNYIDDCLGFSEATLEVSFQRMLPLATPFDDAELPKREGDNHEGYSD